VESFLPVELGCGKNKIPNWENSLSSEKSSYDKSKSVSKSRRKTEFDVADLLVTIREEADHAVSKTEAESDEGNC